MQLARSFNAKRNIAFGYVHKLVTSIVPFFIKAILIRRFGSEYLGLNGLFASVLEVLNLAEMGWSTVSVWCLYKPIAENNVDEICAIINYLRRIYRIIGITILLMGVICDFFLELLIHESIPDGIDIHFLFLLYLINAVMSYLLFGYKTAILSAYQRTDIISRVSVAVYVLQSLTQVLILFCSDNYYLFFGVSIVFTVVNNILIYYCTNRIFPDIICKGVISSDTMQGLKTQIRGLIVARLTDVSRTSLDSIFATGLLGLRITAIYNNYFYIISGIMSYFTIILSSISAGVGNSIVMDSVEKNYDDLIRMDYIYSKLFGWACVFLVCLYQPFMQLWMGKDMMASGFAMVSFVIYFYSKLSISMESVYLSSLGLWKEFSVFAVAEMFTNIILNYILGKQFGLIGIVLSTVISFWVVSIPGSIYVVKINYFVNGMKEYIKIVIGNMLLTSVCCAILFVVTNAFYIENIYLSLIMKFLVCLICTPLLYWLALYKTDRFKDVRRWIGKRVPIKNDKIE